MANIKCSTKPIKTVLKMFANREQPHLVKKSVLIFLLLNVLAI